MTSERLRILQVIEPGRDGVFRHVEGLVRYLMTRGYQVALAYSSVRGSDQLHALVEDIEERGGATLDLRIGNAPEFRDALAVMELARMVHRWGPDLIHVHSSKAGVLGRVIGCFLPQPVVYTPHAYFGLGPRQAGERMIYNAIESVLGRSGATINCSDDELDFANRVLGIPKKLARVIRNGVDVGHYCPPSVGDRRRARECI